MERLQVLQEHLNPTPKKSSFLATNNVSADEYNESDERAALDFKNEREAATFPVEQLIHLLNGNDPEYTKAKV